EWYLLHSRRRTAARPQGCDKDRLPYEQRSSANSSAAGERRRRRRGASNLDCRERSRTRLSRAHEDRPPLWSEPLSRPPRKVLAPSDGGRRRSSGFSAHVLPGSCAAREIRRFSRRRACAILCVSVRPHASRPSFASAADRQCQRNATAETARALVGLPS